MEITLEQLLGARDARYARQLSLTEAWPDRTLVCLTVVLPGPVKRDARSLKVAEAAVKTEFKNVSIVPSDIKMAGADLEISQMENREAILKKGLAAVRDTYDFILIDCPPSLNLITINALNAADSILVPIQCEYYALEGLAQLTNTVSRIKRSYNSHLEIEGVLFTMYDGRLNLTQEVAEQVKKFFPKQVFKTAIPRNVRLSEAPSFGQPINYFDKKSKGAEAYDKLAKEIIKKNKR